MSEDEALRLAVEEVHRFRSGSSCSAPFSNTNVYVAALLSRSGSPARLVQALGDASSMRSSARGCLTSSAGFFIARRSPCGVAPAGVADEFVQWLGRVAISVPTWCPIRCCPT